MNNKLITEIEQKMLKILDNAQMQALHEVLAQTFENVTVTEMTELKKEPDNEQILTEFFSAKRIEGCSDKSLNYYRKIIISALNQIGKAVKHITTDDLRAYLTKYQEEKSLSKVTMDNIRRVLSSFFHGSKMRTISLKVLFVVFIRSRQARLSRKRIQTKIWKLCVIIVCQSVIWR